MAHPLETGARALETLSEAVGRLVAWLIVAMVLVMFAVVVMRYAFDFGRIYIQESVTWMHAAVFMLGAAYTLRHEGHVRVDIFYRRFSRRTRAWVDLLGTLVLLLPVTLYLLWTGWGYVADSWAMREGSLQTGGLPAVYLLKSVLLAMPALLLIQGLAMLLLRLAAILGISDGPDPMERHR
ncbi:MAG TPA: TRAP transporter small permease subunit [Thiohalobacter sp.]|nr:TRAP transporter small permease subunit [Thiohalobacter sp.]